MTVKNRITLSGDVHFILADGCHLKAEQGIEVGSSFTVYAQSADAEKMGKITASGITNYAGIGSGYLGSCGNITINGGFVTATGGKNASGIGSGVNSVCENITINGGDVTATGGSYGAGIGGGYVGTGSSVTIRGGTVDAEGGGSAAGIGSGYGGTQGSNCTVTIDGGAVTARGGGYGAGIGSGESGESGKSGNCTAAIRGGDITATGGKFAAGVGSGYYGNCTLTVGGGDVTATGGSYGAGIGNGFHGVSTVTFDPDVTFSAAAGDDEASAVPCTVGQIENDRYVSVTTVFTGEYESASLTLDSDICLNFYLVLSEDAKANGTMRFTIGSREVDGGPVRVNEKTGRTFFSCPLNVLEMAEEVTAVFTYGGRSYEQSCSAEEYIDKVIKENDGTKYPEELKVLARKIANYGHYAQEYLASLHDSVKLVGPEDREKGEEGYLRMKLFDGEYDVNTKDAKDALSDGFAITKKADGYSLYGRTVYFDSATALNCYVTVPAGVTPKAVCDGGKKVTVKKYTAKANTYIVSVKDITALELGTDFTVTVDGLVLEGSVLDYCGAVIRREGQTEEAVGAMAAFYEYYQAAAAYAASLSGN